MLSCHVVGAVMLLSVAYTADIASAFSAVRSGQKPTAAPATPWGVTIGSDGAMMDIPARRMWGWGPGLSGYCGSMSFQMAGLFHGNYISEEQVRYAGGNWTQILLGSNNDVTAARTLKYDFELWKWCPRNNKIPQSYNFLEWVRDEVDKAHLVIAGWFEREHNGDEDYDHIMPIVGYELNANKTAVDGLYHYSLYLDNRSLTSGSDLHSTRSECAQRQKPVQPYHYCLPDEIDYGISIHGIKDDNNECFRMKLVAPQWNEPDWGNEDQVHAHPEMFIFQAVITGLTAGHNYTVLRFDSPMAVPTSDFKRGPYSANISFTATGTNHQLDLDPVRSDGTWFYRTVEGTV